MIYQLSELNERARSDPKGFLEECDQHYHGKICQAADAIANHLSQSPVVLLSGPSGSGKTTTALKIGEELNRRGIRTHTISMDHYYTDVDPETTPRLPDGTYDYEAPERLDLKLMGEHFAQLSRGQEIQVPYFSFTSKKRDLSRSHALRLGKDEVAIFEGIHALNDRLTGRDPKAFRLYIAPAATVMEGETLRFHHVWMRLTRRVVRDHNFRNTDILSTLRQWPNVREGELLYIEPFRGGASLSFDSAFPCEVNVMRSLALPLFEEIRHDPIVNQDVMDMMDAFHLFEPIDPQLLQGNSLLREFVGGSSYFE